MTAGGRYRVVGWSTGWVGRLSIRAIARRSELELVGVWVHDTEKAGRDAGVLAGIEPIGVEATNDAQALLALAPDCVCHSATGPRRDEGEIPVVAEMLSAGINVVSVSMPGLVYPPGYDAKARAVLEEAAHQGGATLYVSGIEPGFAADELPLTLLTLCDRVRSVRTQEMFMYDEYPDPYMRELFGFGYPLDYAPLMSSAGAQAATWGPSVRMIADALDVEVDELKETYERVVTEQRLEVASGVIEVGTVGAVRFETVGVVAGRDAIVIEHINRMAADLAPQWPNARNGTYRVLVDGVPDIQCDLQLGSAETANDAGMTATAMRIVNAIPYVCDAPPGVVSSRDLPVTVPRACVP
jgi:hypothetical protein